MRKELIEAGVFGAVDGIGLAIGLLLVLGPKGILAAAAANAAAEFAGMSSGEWLSRRGEPLRIPVALANGFAAAVGALLPIVAYVVAGVPAAIGVLIASVVWIAWSTPSKPWWKSWVETFSIVGIVTLIVYAVSFLV